MSDFPLAYHITVGTYGTRLHGDERGTVDRRRNQYGEPIIGLNEDWQRIERALLKFDPVLLSPEQRMFAEKTIPDICQRGGWTYHIAAGREDHVHTLLSSPNEGVVIRRLLKRWLSEAMSGRWPRPEGAVWWVECGSVKWVWDEWYFDNVYEYVNRQRTTE